MSQAPMTMVGDKEAEAKLHAALDALREDQGRDPMAWSLDAVLVGGSAAGWVPRVRGLRLRLPDRSPGSALGE